MKPKQYLNQIAASAVVRDFLRPSNVKTKDLPIGYFTIGKEELYNLKSEDIATPAKIENWIYFKTLLKPQDPADKERKEFDQKLLRSSKFMASFPLRKKYSDS